MSLCGGWKPEQCTADLALITVSVETSDYLGHQTHC